jgi:nitrite reductase/ring-hydroxylating ferredoxin subunit/uncharacterized membrane protein
MKELPVVGIVEDLEKQSSLDPLIERVEGVVKSLVPAGPVRDVLHGVPAGHPIHPIGILIPVGAWMSVAILDAVPGTERAARMLVGAGVLAAGPTAVAGFTDWSLARREQQRVGIVHAAANLAAVGLYGVSYLQRRRGRQFSGKLFALAGLAVVSASGYLGGHMSYRQGTGVKEGASTGEREPLHIDDGWRPLGLVDSFQEGRLTSSLVDEVPVVVVRDGATFSVLADRCPQCGNPLHDGELTGDADDRRLVCPEDGSEFLLATGAVAAGPATVALVRFDALASEGMVEVRAA